MTHAPPEKPPPRPEPFLSRVWSSVSLLVSLAITGAFLVWLLSAPPEEAEGPSPAPPATVRAAGPGLISVELGSKLDLGKKGSLLRAALAAQRRLSSPLMTVTGTVVASLRPGAKEGPVYWQFSTPEVLSAYTDWQKATNEIAFTSTNLLRVRELAETRIASQKKVVARSRRLVEAGTDTPKELATETANLLQYEIQGKKDIHDAETAIRVARRNEAAFAQQLQQAGLEPSLLKSATADIDIVMADVPEGVLDTVKVGQGVTARFFGLPHRGFNGKVNRIAPVLSRERRSLRVLFFVEDPDDKLRPGMFADIGIGTDPRDAILVPAPAVLHVGQKDYVLTEAGPGLWRAAEVSVGEPIGLDVEIRTGLAAGTRVAGMGALLLKPALVKALDPEETAK